MAERRTPKGRSAPQVILYSLTLHTWEVWSQSRPLGHGSLANCQEHYPRAEGPSEHQLELAEGDHHG